MIAMLRTVGLLALGAAVTVSAVVARGGEPVAEIHAFDETGESLGVSGGVAIGDGLVLTTLTGIDRAYEVRVRLVGGEAAVASGVAAWDEARDLALLRVELSEGTRAVRVSDSGVAVGDTVEVLLPFEHEGGTALRRSRCEVLEVRSWAEEGELITLDLGVSGDERTLVGPVFDASGRLCALTRMPAGGSKTFAVGWTQAAAIEGGEALTLGEFAERRLSPRSSARRLHIEASMLMAEGGYAEAERLLRQAVRLRPGFWRAHLDLGVCADMLGERGDAIASIRRAIRIAPEFAEAHYSLGLALLRQAKYADAEAPLRRAMELDGAYGAAQTMLGASLYGQGNVEAAIEETRGAIEIERGQAMAHRNLLLYLRVANRKEAEYEAATAYAEAIPGDVWARLAAGDGAVGLGRFDVALGHFEEAMRLEPEDPEIVLRVAICCGRLGDRARAADLLERALELRPGDDGVRAAVEALRREGAEDGDGG
jgi:Flp pilus assembly protein TadD